MILHDRLAVMFHSTGLAEKNKIICVRLALFAEMMKGKPWTPTTLKEVGSTVGEVENDDDQQDAHRGHSQRLPVDSRCIDLRG